MKIFLVRTASIGALFSVVCYAGQLKADQQQAGRGPADPATVVVDFAADCGIVKPMNAVNNGPVGGENARYGNFTAFKSAKIPFARTHDASEYIGYGADHCVDISAVFPNFDADEKDPKNYDFAVTDAYLGKMRHAGTEPFYRLGQRVEHAAKRYNVYPPKDYAKWARICENVIRHYNRGWANGFFWSIRYWEIWNEADLDWKGDEPPKMWGGTPEDFYRLFEVAAKHLKSKFPELMIGGPAVSGGNFRWGEEFFKWQRDHGTPMDFFSWHTYACEPAEMVKRAKTYRDMMSKYGYGGCESILNEWNYVKNWREGYHYSIEQLASQKGAAFVAAAMIASQNAPVDMLMYYDAKPTADFNGLFDKVTFRPLAPYYAISAWGRLAACRSAVKATSDVPEVYVAAARGRDGRRAIMLARYSDGGDLYCARPVVVRLANGSFPAEVQVCVTDAARCNTATWARPKSAGELCIAMEPQSFALVEFDEPPAASDKSFVCATFNIRIDTDGKGNPIDKGDNAWTERRTRVVDVIRRGKFDLIGFQEVTPTMWKDLLAMLPEYRFADGTIRRGPNPIAFRPELFERVGSGIFALSENTNDYNTVTWGASGVRKCQWALLKVKSTGRLMRVFSMHPDWKGMEQRVKGMGLVLDLVKQAKAKGELVVLTGDMNDMEGDVSMHRFAPYDKRYLVGDSIRLAQTELSDALDITETPHTGPVMSCHGYKPVNTSRLDYIFVSDGFRVLSHHTHADRPGGKFPSDHDAVSARLDFK